MGRERLLMSPTPRMRRFPLMARVHIFGSQCTSIPSLNPEPQATAGWSKNLWFVLPRQELSDFGGLLTRVRACDF